MPSRERTFDTTQVSTRHPPGRTPVVHYEGLAIRLFGYDSEAEVVRTAQSLRRGSAGE